MGFVSEIKKGESLTAPKATLKWFGLAVVGIVLLIGAALVALFVWGKGSAATTNIPVVGTITAPMRVYAS